MVSFIDAHRGELPVVAPLVRAPLATGRADLRGAADRPIHLTHDHTAGRADPARRSDRSRRDEALRPEIRHVFEETWGVYGLRKVWRQLRREGFEVARCTVGRLMKSMGIQGIIRGRPHRTTIPDRKAPSPLDKVNRQFARHCA